MSESGYVFFPNPMPIDIGNGPQLVTHIDLQLQSIPGIQKMNLKNVSLQTNNGWINAKSRYPETTAKTTMMVFDVISVTPKPRFRKFSNWDGFGLVYNGNQLISRTHDMNRVAAG